MNKSALFHSPKSNYAFALDKNSLCLRFRTARDDVNNIDVLYSDKFLLMRQKMNRINMVKWLSDELFDYYEAVIHVPHNRYVYYFEITKDDKKVLFGDYGIFNFDKNKLYFDTFQFPYIHKRDLHEIPRWVYNRVFYQIFPDRFFKSENMDNKPRGVKFTKWGKLPTRNSVYGGNIAGIIEKLDHINDLGINAIYLTPIFKSPSNHKYDTTDYYQIDEHFGTKEEFKELIEQSHKRGIKIILDCVFNHSGYTFELFQDVVKNGKNSKYYDWFYIKDEFVKLNPPNYLTFAFEKKMPKLNTSNHELRAYLLGVAKYWIEEFDIDGWRLDVSDEIDHKFWREFRDIVKGCKKDALILGENWFNSYPWLEGDQYDGVMNYPITRACIDFFACETITSSKFSDMLSSILIRNTHIANRGMLNLLDSHDTARFITLCGGEKQKLEKALAFIFLFVGMPCIYYGTEILLEGGGDPDCRRTFNWDKNTWDFEFQNYLKKLISIRKNENALKYGSIKVLSQREMFVMERVYAKEKIVLLINNSNTKSDFVIKGRKVQNLLDSKEKLIGRDLKITVDKNSYRIFKTFN